MEPEKYFITYNEIHETVKSLADDIIDSGYEPDVMVAIGTGGFIPARILKTFLEKPILTVGIAYYDKHNQRMDSPKKIQWIDEVEKKIEGKKVLLIDEVDDTRVTLEYCLRELLSHNPKEIAIAVLHNKAKAKAGKIPDEVSRYFCGRKLEDHWICYPWDADDILSHDKSAQGVEA